MHWATLAIGLGRVSWTPTRVQHWGFTGKSLCGTALVNGTSLVGSHSRNRLQSLFDKRQETLENAL